MVKEYEVTLKFDSDMAAENTYMALVTAVSMLKSFSGNVPRFRNNYLETFTQAEQKFAEEENVTASEASEWTHDQLRIYFANLQNAVYAVAVAMEPHFADHTVPVDRDALIYIDGHVHDSVHSSTEELEGGADLPEDLRKEIEAIFQGLNTERN
jgi:hypothetical protein